MATRTVDKAVEECKNCLINNTSFVLQGGAGSGKTESLKVLLNYLNSSKPNSKVMCITHTNVAVDEILSRTNSIYPASTIHSFLNNLIKDYKKNIHSVIAEIFYVPLMIRGIKDENTTDKDYKKQEHENYKDIYSKYAKKLYAIKNQTIDKAVGKREYDSNPEKYNNELNQCINELNKNISVIVSKKDCSKICYNDTSFNSLTDLTYGHDGLLEVFHLLINNYPILEKIIADKFDYIFIDEYQDTNSDIICDFIRITQNTSLCLALFGDSMQAIYKEGVGDVEEYVGKDLKLITKPDNYRCSYEVIDTINTLRLDDIQQKVALKKEKNGQLESTSSRHGSVKVYYSVLEHKPNSRSSAEEKAILLSQTDKLIKSAKQFIPSAKVLMLTNKSIAEKNKFLNLYNIFSNRYSEVKDQIEKYLLTIQVLEVCDICNAFLNKNYNYIIKSIQKGGFVIHSIKDKESLYKTIKSLTEDKNISAWKAVEFAREKKIIKESEACKERETYEKQFLNEIHKDSFYLKFKKLYPEHHTFAQMKKIPDKIIIDSQEEFDELEYKFKKEQFINGIFSDEFKFEEAMNFSKYLAEKTEYITMHKTKGSSIENVIVVMEEFFWNQYDFSSIYFSYPNPNIERNKNSQKLFYVACSRAQKNLVCVRVLEEKEVDDFLSKFPFAKFVE